MKRLIELQKGDLVVEIIKDTKLILPIGNVQSIEVGPSSINPSITKVTIELSTGVKLLARIFESTYNEASIIMAKDLRDDQQRVVFFANSLEEYDYLLPISNYINCI